MTSISIIYILTYKLCPNIVRLNTLLGFHEKFMFSHLVSLQIQLKSDIEKNEIYEPFIK